MLPGATLFGVMLVLVILVSFALLMIRKPSLSLGELPAETIKLETKSKKSEEVTKKVSGTCPKYLGYLATIPKNTRIPNECVTCTEIGKCQDLNAFHSEEVSEKAKEIIENLKDSEKPLEQVETPKIVKERQSSTAPRKNLEEMPSGCLHFFGYLRDMPKNTLIPDDCLGCSKIVECMYHVVLG